MDELAGLSRDSLGKGTPEDNDGLNPHADSALRAEAVVHVAGKTLQMSNPADTV